MARTINEIFNDMVAAKESESSLSSLTSSSVTAIWRLLFYVVSVGVNTLEKLFDAYKQDVDERIGQIFPGSAKWYASKMLNFMANKTLIAESDEYDTSLMTEDEIKAAKVVKHAVAVEDSTSSVLTIKVAGENNNGRCTLDQATEIQLMSYISAIKYAGVRVILINKTADIFNCEVDIYYNPQRNPEDVQQNCRNAIKEYIENLPFNGEYTNMALVDTLQKVDGVKIVEFKSASSKEYGSDTESNINARKEPAAGYFSVGELTINMMAYEQI